jgi:hypothetical protein
VIDVDLKKIDSLAVGELNPEIGEVKAMPDCRSPSG